MVNTFSDSSHKAAVFKSADKVHSDVLEVLQRATHTTQCLYERWPARWRTVRWMGLDVWRGRICGLSPEMGSSWLMLSWPLKPQGSRSHCVHDRLWSCWHSREGPSSSQHPSLLPHFAWDTTVHKAAPLFKRFLWLVLPSLLYQVFLVGLLSFSYFFYATEFLSGPPSYSSRLFLLLQLRAWDEWLLLRSYLLSPGPQRSICSSHHIKKSSLLRLFLRIRKPF